jgi:hypothetical protein
VPAGPLPIYELAKPVGTACSPHERSDMRGSRNPGCRFAHPGYAPQLAPLTPPPDPPSPPPSHHLQRLPPATAAAALSLQQVARMSAAICGVQGIPDVASLIRATLRCSAQSRRRPIFPLRPPPHLLQRLLRQRPLQRFCFVPRRARSRTSYSSSPARITGIASPGLNLTDQGYRADSLEAAEA